MKLNAGQKVGLLILLLASIFIIVGLSTDRYRVDYTVYTAQPDGSFFDHQRSITVYDFYMPNEEELAWDDAQENCALTVDSVRVNKFFCNNTEISLDE